MLIQDHNIDPNDVAVLHRITTNVAPAVSLTNAIVRLIKATDHALRVTAAKVYTRAVAGAVAFDLAISPADGLLFPGILAIDAVPEKFKLIANTVVYLAAGVVKTKAPATAIVFSAAHTVNTAGAAGQYFGAILVQVDAAGTVTTKVSSADQVFTTLAAAIAALPAHDAGKPALGYITIKSKAATAWTANTDDMTNGSDVDTATFVAYPVRKPLTGTITPLAGTVVEGTMAVNAAPNSGGDTTQIEAAVGEYVAILTTTDGTGALTDGFLSLHYRAGKAYRGENT